MEFIDLNLYGIREVEEVQRNINYYKKRLYEHPRDVSIYEENRIRLKMGGDKGVHLCPDPDSLRSMETPTPFSIP